ncbi:hypothetical protein JW898_00100 [Candidatus Woesearchaeota archaeon]|nr:hypothetical protein [Candidatus Woesearchaeota archaeon]
MKSKSKGLSLKTTTALIIIIFLLGIGTTMWYYALYKVAYVKIYDIEIKTSPDKFIGFNVDPTLHFGILPSEGGIGKKELNVMNDWDIPLLLSVRINGDAAQFIKVEDNNFILQPGEARSIAVYAIIPAGFGQEGIYTGEAKIIYLRP